MTENRKLKVFLCHSKNNKSQVREIYNRLVTDGFDAWLDEEKLLPGQEWDPEIQKAVRASDIVVVCLSNSSVTKTGYVQKEIRFALDVADEQPEDTIYIIPARLEDCDVPSRLTKWHWVNLFDTEGYKKLKASLENRAKELGITYLHLESPYLVSEAPQMIHIPAGKFLMGSTKKQVMQLMQTIKGPIERWADFGQPQHEVELSEYSIGKYLVTNREYQAYVQELHVKPPRSWDGENYPLDKGNHPVVYVSWDNAQAYCQWLSRKTGQPYRLPTEAEWEKAARGNHGGIYPWGDTFELKKANTLETNIGTTTPVGQFSQAGGDSLYGCADMAGNVWEWCNDWFNKTEYKTRLGQIVKDPPGPLKGRYRIMRGGSFDYNLAYGRCAYRLSDLPDLFDAALGFRICLTELFTDESEN